MRETVIILGFLILASCGSLTDAGKVLRNEKTNSTDEFLVKKKNPLVLPPDYNKLPKPGSMKSNKQNEEDKIKNILKVPKETRSGSNKTSTVEQSIIDKIRK